MNEAGLMAAPAPQFRVAALQRESGFGVVETLDPLRPVNKLVIPSLMLDVAIRAIAVFIPSVKSAAGPARGQFSSSNSEATRMATWTGCGARVQAVATGRGNSEAAIR